MAGWEGMRLGACPQADRVSGWGQQYRAERHGWEQKVLAVLVLPVMKTATPQAGPGGEGRRSAPLLPLRPE